MRLRRALDLPAGLPEQEVYAHLRELAARNVSAEDELCFLGAGMYDHYVPALVDMLMERSEFLTPYTPYQPEVSQGGLQVMFEYQTAICELTGLPVANASVYEGPSRGRLGRATWPSCTTAARASSSARACTRIRSQTLRTYAHGFGAEVVEVPLRDGRTDAEAWAARDRRGDVRGDLRPAQLLRRRRGRRALSAAAKAAARAAWRDRPPRVGGPVAPVVISQVDPIVLGVLAPPGECGVDVAVGEGQSLGNRLDFGGPSFGFFAAREQYLRRMPGRIAGETRDVDGRRGFVLTLQTREQHIRREKATSNICTAQALNALAGSST